MSVSKHYVPKGTSGMNIKPFAIIIILFSQFLYGSEIPLIFMEDGKLHYDGPLTEEGVLKFKETYNESSHPLRWMVIRSQGGEINTGIALGEFIFEHNLNIVVNQYCFSSCANYVFTAANKKRLGKSTLVGFHGGASSSFFNTGEMEEHIMSFPEEQRESIRQEMSSQLNSYLIETKNSEHKYFDKIGVSALITTLGQEDKYSHLMDSGEYIGWYYSISDLKKLGVKDIEVTNPPWEPVPPKGKLKVYMVGVGI